MNLDAQSAADDLHADLASWVLLVLEERPDGPSAPSWRGSDVRPASKRRTSTGIIYEDARVTGVRDSAATLTLVRWLLVQMDWMLAQPWVDAMVTEIPEKVWTLKARWPTEQRPVYLPVPCPACNMRSLYRYAPRWLEAPVTVSCAMVECGHVVEEDGFAWLTKVLKRETGAA